MKDASTDAHITSAEPVILPEDPPEQEVIAPEENSERKNLAGDDDLTEKVKSFCGTGFKKLRDHPERTELKEVWKIAANMLACAQDDSTTETERQRVSRDSDDLSKTNAKKVGSTLFLRQVASIAGWYNNVFRSKPDPYAFKPRQNEEVYLSGEQQKVNTASHNLLMRYSREQENYSKKFVEFLWQLIPEGNVPTFVHWCRESAEILDNWPVYEDGPDGQKVVAGTKRERRMVTTANRPVSESISNERFYADPNIPDLQQQPLIGITSFASFQDLEVGEREDGFLNIEKLDASLLYQGGDDTEVEEQKNEALGLAGTFDDGEMGLFKQWDFHARLPIDESKGKGKRWSKKHRSKIYWVTLVGKSIDECVCVRCERNLDPHDEMPFTMVSMYPWPKNKLWKMSLTQILRGDYSENTTTRHQMIDDKTLENNPPSVWNRNANPQATGGNASDFSVKKDKAIIVDGDPRSAVAWFQNTNKTNNGPFLAYIESDADEAAGNNRAFRGEPMGGRTSSQEAGNAFNSSQLPHKMLMNYVFSQKFPFEARKCVKMWHLYADPGQIVRITDDIGQDQTFRPSDLYGEFDVELTLVDDYENSLLTMQNISFAAQNLLPMFMPVIDERELGKKLLQQVLHIDISGMMKPDRSDHDRMVARQENQSMMETGQKCSAW